MTAPPAFPAPKDDDDDDVAWALSTALVQWKRGSPPDAIVWLRRAIDSAVAVGATWRAAELTRETDALEAHWMAVQANAQPVVSSARPVTIDEIEIIGDDALSLPPDASLSELPPPPSAGFHDAEVTVRDDHVTTQLDEDDAEIETSEEEEVLELNDDEISEEADEAAEGVDEEIDDDDLGDDAPRFESEAPTGMLRAPMLATPVAELEHPEPDPDSSPTHARFNLTEELAPVQPAHEIASTAEPNEAAEPAEASDAAPEEPYVAGVSLAEISGFEDFPPDMQVRLAKAARVERLATEEEVSGFGLALVLRGAVSVMPTIADVTCGVAQERELVYGKGTIADGVQLRLVAAAPDTQVATWDFEIIGPALSACPWVLADLQAVADRYQALAGVSMGPMGDRLDDSLRGMVLARCKLVKLLPGEVLVEKGKPVGGLFIVGAGRIELEGAKSGTEQLGPGDFVFPTTILMAGSAPAVARAGASGALLMAADRHDAHELMVSVPPLLELLAG